jgi:hypothetical protein
MDELSAVEAIYFAAQALPGDSERVAYLDEACADNPGLRCAVERLLAAGAKLSNFLEEPACVGVEVQVLFQDCMAEGPFRPACGNWGTTASSG